MNMTRPILRSNPSKMERLLLTSSQLDTPPGNAKKRAFAVFGLGGSVIATSQIAGVATAAASTPAAGAAAVTAATGSSAVVAAGATTGFMLALLKGVAIGAVTGAIAYGSIAVHRQHERSRPAPAEHGAVRVMMPQPPTRSSEPPAAAGPVKPPVAVAARVRSTPSAVAAQQLPSLPTEQPSLQSERATIERAQALVRRGDSAAALRTLAEYSRRYPQPQLAPEATLVRIEALRELGQLSDAQRLGRQYLESQPDGPYAPRVRTLLNLPAAP
jgi:hypothetical protein